MSDFILSGLEKKEFPKTTTSLTKDNLFDSYFEGTENISHKPKFLEEFKNNDKVIGWKYSNKNNKLSMLEYFKISNLNWLEYPQI